MPLYAKDEDEILSAWSATPDKTYRCLGCNLPVKYRRSKRQFPHFYHLTLTPSCRLRGKSKKHLQIQLAIQKNLPGAELEKPFASINRIADVVWKHVIFEIQCSQISVLEAIQRTEDYERLGFCVIWVLDDAQFNKKRVKKAELFMRKRTCYFVKGTAFFYDQRETIRGKVRVEKGKKIPIELQKLPPNSLKPQIKKEKSFLLSAYKKFFKKYILSKVS